MKKLLFSLFALAMIVACEKDAFDDNVMPEGIAPIEAEVESVSMDLDIDALTDRLTGIANNSKKYPKKDLSTNRTPGGHIVLVSKLTGNIYEEYLISDDLSYCNTGDRDIVFLVLNAQNQTEIRVGAASGTGSLLLGTITADLSFIYGLTISEGLKIDITNGNVQVVDGAGTLVYDFTMHSFTDADFSCGPVDTWTESSTTTGLWENPAKGSYQVSAAPSPLSGFLARVISEATGISGTLNYAATTEAAVRSAIEGDFGN